MEMKFFVNERKMIVALICCILFAALTAFLFFWQSWVPALFSFLLCLIYGIVALRNGRMVHLNKTGAFCKSFSGTLSVSWTDICEVGVVGLRLFHGKGKKHRGSKNIYFSEKTLSEDELFQLCLNWPPKDMLYFRFSYKRIEAIQRIWAQDIRMYNVSDLHF